MRFALGMTLLLSTASGAVACSSSSSPAAQPEAGSDACSADPATLLASTPGPACPNDGNGNQLTYDQVIEDTCATFKLKTGDIEYGQCFDYLVYEIDNDSTGNNFSRCFYDVATHAFVGVIYADGSQDQCGGSSYTVQAGSVDTTCSISGFQGGGAVYESCKPVVDAGEETMLLGQ
jgi:hypothetical protein